jgi:arylsulfatase A-like enzyme
VTISKRPNILLIFTDQHRLSAVGCYGETPCQTPNLDRLAAEGLRFETAYTVCPVCSPARATIMTGLYPHAHGICSNVHNLGCSIHELTDRPTLLSRQLQAAGYQCGYSGKWHLGTDSTTAFGSSNQPSLPRDVGFEGQNFPGHGGGGFRYPEYKQYLAENGFEHKVYQLNKRPVRVWPYGLLEGLVESTVPYFLAENTIKLMQAFQAAGQPFFMWHNFWGPHGPFYSPRAFYDLYESVEIPEWPTYRWPASQINGPHQVKLYPHPERLAWEDWAEAIRHYYAFTSLIDQQIGRMLDYLEESGLLENTIVIFTADHGQTLGSHGGLTDKGWHHFEEIQRIPTIVRLPERYDGGKRKRGEVLQEWISLADVYPSILELAGADLGSKVHGRSFAPLLRGEPVEWRNTIFVEFNGVNNLATSMVTVRKGNWKYGWNCSNADELYDLAADPHETENRIDDPRCSAQVTEMRETLEAWMVETDYPGLSMYIQSRMGRQPWL